MTGRRATADEILEGEAQAEISVKGKGATVDEALKRSGLKDKAKQLKGKFQDLLRDPRNKIVATRISPKTYRGPDGKNYDCEDTFQIPPPMTLDEITEHLKEEMGGKKWNIRVLDEDGEPLDAKNVTVPGEPKINPDTIRENFDLGSSMNFSDSDEEEEEEDNSDPIDREIAAKTKQSKVLELERANARLQREIIELRGGNNGSEKPEVDVGAAIREALEKQDEKHSREMESMKRERDREDRDRKWQEQLDRQSTEFREALKSKGDSESASSSGLKDIQHQIDLMRQDFKSELKDTLSSYKETTNQQITALEKGFSKDLQNLQTAIQNQKPQDNPIKDMVPLISSSIERSTSGYKDVIQPLMQFVASKPESVENPMKETIEIMQTLGALPKSDGEPRDFGTRVVDFAEKMAPKVFEYISEQREQGMEVTKQAVQNQMKIVAQKIANDVSQHAGKTIRQVATERGQLLPAPQHQQQVPQPTPQPQGQTTYAPPSPPPAQPPQSALQPQPVQPPAPAPAPASQPQPAPSPQPQPAPSQGGEEEEESLTVEDEMKDRVNATLEILEREMKLRPRNLEWPKFAWDNLPAVVLEQIIFANDEEDVYNAIKPYADQTLADRIWQLIRSDQAAKDFIVSGINTIKSWAVEVQEKQRQAIAQSGGQPPQPEQGQPQA